MEKNLVQKTVQYPQTIQLAGGEMVSTTAIARAIAEDDHPGDDSVPPRWLRQCAIDVVNLKRLKGLANIDGDTARAACEAYGDDLQCIGNTALYDALGDAGWGTKPMREENAALVLVVARMMIETERTQLQN